MRVKVSRTDRRRGSWSNTASVGVRPVPHPAAGQLSAADFQLVGDWIQLNRDAITDYRDGMTEIDEVLAGLRRILEDELDTMVNVVTADSGLPMTV